MLGRSYVGQVWRMRGFRLAVAGGYPSFQREGDSLFLYYYGCAVFSTYCQTCPEKHSSLLAL